MGEHSGAWLWLLVKIESESFSMKHCSSDSASSPISKMVWYIGIGLISSDLQPIFSGISNEQYFCHGKNNIFSQFIFNFAGAIKASLFPLYQWCLLLFCHWCYENWYSILKNSDLFFKIGFFGLRIRLQFQFLNIATFCIIPCGKNAVYFFGPLRTIWNQFHCKIYVILDQI